MFCSKCGNQLAEGAVFCSVCGAKVISITEPPVQENTLEEAVAAAEPAMANRVRRYDLDLDWGEDDRPRNTDTKMSFDWSSVIDEGKRKSNRDIRSPWEEPEEPSPRRGITEEEERAFEQSIFSDMNESRPGRSRTMTFIDILKQEREARERQAAEAARIRVEEPDLEPMNNFPDQEAILPENEREITKGYTDLKRDIIAEMEKRDGAGTEFDEQLAAIRAKRVQREELLTPEPPQSFVLDPEEEFAKLLKREAEDVFQPEIPATLPPIVEEPEEPEIPAEPAEPEAVAEPAEPAAEPEPDYHEYDEYLEYKPRGRAARIQEEEEGFAEEPEEIPAAEEVAPETEPLQPEETV
ncbi:MAG: zinc ribbon domain-containing protein, partial [Mogibacterium sp.]|nr:zinc ribbon domain-containing protein [Mogibacterium sp.]